MDLNLVVLAGRLAAPPEHRRLDSGATLTRYLLTIRASQPHARVDVVPITSWGDPAAEFHDAVVGQRVWVAGTVQRRFWEAESGRRSRLEIIGHQVELRGEDVEDSSFRAEG